MTSLILKKNYELLKIYDKGCRIYSLQNKSCGAIKRIIKNVMNLECELHSFNSMNFLKLEKENCLNLQNFEKQLIISIEQEFEENNEK